MDIAVNGLNQIISAPFLVVALVVAVLSTTVRGTINKLRPKLENNKYYKAFFPWAVIALGIGAACVAKGCGQFDSTWGYVILLGVIAGAFSTWLWSAIKQWARGAMGIAQNKE